VASQRKLRALYGKWVEALYSYDVEVWENHVAKTSSFRGSESPCRLAASLVAKAKVHFDKQVKSSQVAFNEWVWQSHKLTIKIQ